MKEVLKDLLSIQSIADHGKDGFPYGPGPAEALDYVLRLCENLGFRTVNADGKYGYAEIGTGGEIIGILCHLDVVPAGEGWTYPPFEGTEADGKIYGRGAMDDKGPAVANIFAMKDLVESGIPLNKRIRIIFGQSEENGDWFDLDAYKEKEEVPDYGYTPDGDFPAIYAEKGILLLTLDMKLEDSGFSELTAGSVPNMVPERCRAILASGMVCETCGKSAHGSAPWEGENALTKMMEQTAEEAPLAKIYMDLIGHDVYGKRLGCAFRDEVSGRLSVNTGLVKIENDRIYLYLDIRYPVTMEKEKIIAGIRSRVGSYGMEVRQVHHMQPVYMEKQGPVMDCLLSAYRKVTGDPSEPIVIGGGTYARAMENIIAFGPTISGHENREHKPDEYILIEDLNLLRKVYRNALEELLRL